MKFSRIFYSVGFPPWGHMWTTDRVRLLSQVFWLRAQKLHQRNKSSWKLSKKSLRALKTRKMLQCPLFYIPSWIPPSLAIPGHPTSWWHFFANFRWIRIPSYGTSTYVAWNVAEPVSVRFWKIHLQRKYFWKQSTVYKWIFLLYFYFGETSSIQRRGREESYHSVPPSNRPPPTPVPTSSYLWASSSKGNWTFANVRSFFCSNIAPPSCALPHKQPFWSILGAPKLGSIGPGVVTRVRPLDSPRIIFSLKKTHAFDFTVCIIAHDPTRSNRSHYFLARTCEQQAETKNSRFGWQPNRWQPLHDS